MPTSIYWLLPERVAYLQVTGALTIAEIEASHQFHVKLMDATTHDHPLHFIFDTHLMDKGPSNMFEVRRVNQAFVKHPKVGWVVALEGNPVARFLSSVVAQMGRTPMKSVATWEDALAFLAYIDTTLPSLPNVVPTGEPLVRIEKA